MHFYQDLGKELEKHRAVKSARMIMFPAGGAYGLDIGLKDGDQIRLRDCPHSRNRCSYMLRAFSEDKLHTGHFVSIDKAAEQVRKHLDSVLPKLVELNILTRRKES